MLDRRGGGAKYGNVPPERDTVSTIRTLLSEMNGFQLARDACLLTNAIVSLFIKSRLHLAWRQVRRYAEPVAHKK